MCAGCATAKSSERSSSSHDADRQSGLRLRRPRRERPPGGGRPVRPGPAAHAQPPRTRPRLRRDGGGAGRPRPGARRPGGDLRGQPARIPGGAVRRDAGGLRAGDGQHQAAGRDHPLHRRGFGRADRLRGRGFRLRSAGRRGAGFLRRFRLARVHRAGAGPGLYPATRRHRRTALHLGLDRPAQGGAARPRRAVLDDRQAGRDPRPPGPTTRA